MDDQASPPAPASPTEADDVDALVAERDALRSQLAARSWGRWGRGARRIGAVVLVVLFAFSFLASGVGIWLHRSTLNEDVWSDRVVPLAEDPEVQQALATWTTDQLMTTVDPEALFEEALPERGQILAIPLSAAVREFVGDRVDAFFASDRFEDLWARAAVRAHEGAVAVLRDERSKVVAGDEEVTINLIPIIDEVLANIVDAAPGLVGSDAQLPDVSVEDVPDAARDRLGEALGVDLDDDFGTLTVYDGDKLSTAQELVRLFDRLVIFTAVLTLVTAAAALWVSPRRRRTLFQLLGVTALVCIVIRRVGFTLQDEVIDLVRVEENRGAASVVVSTFVDPLTNAAATVLWVVAAVAVVAAVTGPYGWAVRLRRTASQTARSMAGAVGEGARDERTAKWITDHVDALRLAGYALGALILWFADLSWLTLLVVAAVVVAWQVALRQLVPKEPDSALETAPSEQSAPMPEGDAAR